MFLLISTEILEEEKQNVAAKTHTVGPTNKEVPESAIAAQPAEQYPERQSPSLIKQA